MDRLEQYNCGENITINGLLETARENTSEVVVKLGREIGVEVTRGDISERLESWEVWKDGANLGQVRAEGEEDGVLKERRSGTHVHCLRPNLAQS